jgi:F-type H+-transporting ATPase subunit epsilon
MLTVTIITPEKALAPYQAQHATITAEDGELGIRPGHAPVVAELKTGFALIRDAAGKETMLALKGGVAQILNNQVKLFVEAAMDAANIDQALVAKRLDELGSANATDAATIKRNEAEALWYLMLQSVANRKAS